MYTHLVTHVDIACCMGCELMRKNQCRLRSATHQLLLEHRPAFISSSKRSDSTSFFPLDSHHHQHFDQLCARKSLKYLFKSVHHRYSNSTYILRNSSHFASFRSKFSFTVPINICKKGLSNNSFPKVPSVES